MSYEAVVRFDRPMNEGGEIFTFEVFDLENFGALIQATSLSTGKIYTLSVSERQLIEAGLSKSSSDLIALVETLSLEHAGQETLLVSSDPSIPRPKRNLNENDVVDMIKAPTQTNTSLHDVLVKGLVELCKVKPVGNDAVQWLGEWLLENNPNRPSVTLPTD